MHDGVFTNTSVRCPTYSYIHVHVCLCSIANTTSFTLYIALQKKEGGEDSFQRSDGVSHTDLIINFVFMCADEEECGGKLPQWVVVSSYLLICEQSGIMYKFPLYSAITKEG